VFNKIFHLIASFQKVAC